jgi:hypothetical protein
VQSAAPDLKKLIALKISNGALASAPNLPARLKILAWGENATVKGPVRLGEKSARVLPLNQKALGFEEVALDFEHNTLEGSPEFARTKEPRAVAAYGKLSVIAGDGLYLDELRWTPTGKTEAFNFADLSPAIELDADGDVTFLHSVALTRNGAVHDLSFFNADKKIMTNPNPNAEMFTVADFSAAFGLRAEAVKDDVLKKLTDLCALTALDGRLKALEAGATVTAAATITALTARLEKLESLQSADATAREKAERGQIIVRFAAEGKVPLKPDGAAYTTEELLALSADTLRLLLANAAASVPLHARGARLNAEGKTEPRPAREVWKAGFQSARN